MFRVGSSRWCLLVSVGLHAGLAAWLYHLGTVDILRRQDTEVAASVRATAQARMARRVEDLRKIKELLEQSAQRAPEPAPSTDATAATHGAAAAEPERMLEQARTMARAIDELGQELKAEELARLTDRTKEEARAEVDAAAPPHPVSEAAPGGDPAAELAALEARARAVLASRAGQLAREREGVTVEREGARAAGTGDDQGMSGIGDGDGDGVGPDESSASGLGSGLGKPQAGVIERTAEEIARFMREGEEAERDWTSRAYRHKRRDIFAGGRGKIPGFDTARMVKGSGRTFGAGGQYANRIYLNSWYMIGPFQGRHGLELFNNPRHPPEDAVLLDAAYYGKDQRVVKWEYVSAASYPLVPRVAEENAVYYGYTEVSMDRERDMLVWIGADDDVAVKVNDRLIWQAGNSSKRWFYQSVYGGKNTYQRDYNRTEGQRLVRFRKGRNTIFFKLSNGPTRLFFSMLLTPTT
ncbi:hypothetical protein B0920_01500 [Massilia sp. KIM]|nr:hypothetical protein B0920_01500 [Massilia sp. KIM]